jgi:hypothetical protein
MVNSESTTQVIWMLMWLMKKCPAHAAGLKALAYDAACIARSHVDAKVRDLPKTSTALPFYKRIAELKFFVDNFHAPNHNVDDKFCQDNCQPGLYPEYSEGTNTEVCEQTFKWLGRFKVIVNSMGLSKATFFLSVMMYAHNRRTLRTHPMSSRIMPTSRLAEVRAAYKLPAVPDSATSRRELAELVLEGRRAWSASARDNHVARAVAKRKRGEPVPRHA